MFVRKVSGRKEEEDRREKDGEVEKKYEEALCVDN